MHVTSFKLCVQHYFVMAQNACHLFQVVCSTLLCNEHYFVMKSEINSATSSPPMWIEPATTGLLYPTPLYILMHFKGTSPPTKRVSHLPGTPLATSIVTREGPRRCDTCQKRTHPWQWVHRWVHWKKHKILKLWQVTYRWSIIMMSII